MVLIKDEHSALHASGELCKSLGISFMAMACSSTMKFLEAEPFSTQCFTSAAAGIIFTGLGVLCLVPPAKDIRRKKAAEPDAIKADQIMEMRTKFVTSTLYKISEALVRVARTLEASNSREAKYQRMYNEPPAKIKKGVHSRRTRKALRRNRKAQRRQSK